MIFEQIVSTYFNWITMFGSQIEQRFFGQLDQTLENGHTGLLMIMKGYGWHQTHGWQFRSISFELLMHFERLFAWTKTKTTLNNWTNRDQHLILLVNSWLKLMIKGSLTQSKSQIRRRTRQKPVKIDLNPTHRTSSPRTTMFTWVADTVLHEGRCNNRANQHWSDQHDAAITETTANAWTSVTLTDSEHIVD